MRHIMFILLVIFVHTVSAQRQKEWPAAIKGSEKVVYKTIGELKLHLHTFHPVKQKIMRQLLCFSSGEDGREVLRSSLSSSAVILLVGACGCLFRCGVGG